MILELKNEYPLIVIKLELFEILTFTRFMQFEKVFSHIFVTLSGIEISSQSLNLRL